MNQRTPKEKLEEVAALSWMHSIDLGDGIVTPGRSLPNPLVLEVFDTVDFKGKRVLDVGCWDGLWSFEAEKRGAREVCATDDISQRSFHDTRSFECARRLLKSNVKYFPNVNIEDLPELPEAPFDVVLFLGVIYHLRDPLRALAILRSVTTEQGIIVINGEVWYDFHRSFATFHYSSAHEGDNSNWWVPTVKCMEEWVESSFFRRTGTFCYATKNLKSRLVYLTRRWLCRMFGNWSALAGRAVVVARAFKGKDPRWVFPDRLFAAVDENEYSSKTDASAATHIGATAPIK